VLYPHEYFWYSFLLEAESTPEASAAGRIRTIENASGLTTHNLPGDGDDQYDNVCRSLEVTIDIRILEWF
jgi:hypothetical protein